MFTKNANKETKSNFKKFSKEEDEVWSLLCAKQIPNLKEKASKLWLEGFELLGMSIDRVPDFEKVSEKLNILTGWTIDVTNEQYEDGALWLAEGMANKKIRITQYIREMKDLDYTPLPDVFHDALGHIPFLAIPQYARIAEKFGKAILKTETKEERQKIVNNWWFGFEFSLIEEDQEIKAFGTGLMSSVGELNHSLSNKVETEPFDSEVVSNLTPSVHEFHDKFFIVKNLDQLEEAIDKWI